MFDSNEKDVFKLWAIWSDSKTAKGIRTFVGYAIFFQIIGFLWVYGWAYVSDQLVYLDHWPWWVTWIWVIGFPLFLGIIFIEIPVYYSNKRFWENLEKENANARAELDAFCKAKAKEREERAAKAKKRKKKA